MLTRERWAMNLEDLLKKDMSGYDESDESERVKDCTKSYFEGWS